MPDCFNSTCRSARCLVFAPVAFLSVVRSSWEAALTKGKIYIDFRGACDAFTVLQEGRKVGVGGALGGYVLCRDYIYFLLAQN